MKAGAHKRVWEYDGMFSCLDCERKWGAILGNPKQPKECDKDYVQMINITIKKYNKKINDILKKIEKLEDFKNN